MNKKISIILNILIIILLTTVAYGWMQTEPSVGELVEYDKNFYITDSDIEVKLFTLVDSVYVEQNQYVNEPVISIDNAYPGKIQRYRFELTNNKQTPARVKIVFTNIGGEIHLTKDYYIINGTNPDTFTFRVSQRLEYNEENDRYFFNLIKSVQIPAESTINYYWNIQIDIDAPNALQGTSFSVGKIMFIKP
jgi:hypothetical protein